MDEIPHTLSILVKYIQQRCPVVVVVIIALLLFSAGIQTTSVASGVFLKGWFTMVIFLFLVRFSDDLCDLPLDKVVHPDRVLCTATINRERIDGFRGLLVALILLIQLPNLYAMLFLMLAIIFYYLFFLAKPKLPTLVHVCLLNSALFVFPVYCGFLLNQQVSRGQLAFGLFFWLGSFAHDLAHSLLDTENKKTKALSSINLMNQRFLAKLSLVLFLSAGGLGLYLYHLQYVGEYFLYGLLVCSLSVLFLEMQLIKKPSAKNAHPFYIAGYLFFLIPAMLHLIDVTIA